VQLALKVLLVCLESLAGMVLKGQKESQVMVEKLVPEVQEVLWVPLAEMVNAVGLVETENVEEAVHLEPKVNKAILECQDYQVPKVILVFLGSQGNLVLMDPQENLARMGLKDNQALKEIWDLVDSWDREDSQVQLVSQAFLDWKAQKVQRAPWDLWVGPEILELQDHQDPLVLQVLRVQLVLRVCPALLESLDFQVFQVLMDCLVLPEHLDHQERKENQVHRDLKASLGIQELEA